MNKLVKRTAVFMTIGLAFSTVTPLAIKTTNSYSVLNRSVSADTTNDVTDNLENQDYKNLQMIKNQSEQGIDISMMTSQERDTFEKIVQNSVDQMNLPSKDDTQDAYQQILAFFDSNSENYQNVQETTENLSNDIDRNHSSLLDSITGEKVLAANHGTVSTAVLGSILNVAIGVAVGGVVGGVAQAIKSKGKAWVKGVLMSQLKKTLIGVELGSLAYMLSKGVDFALDYMSPGTALARYFDGHDKIKNNGYIELW